MGLARRLKVTQRAIERASLEVSLRDRIRNEEIRRRTKVTDITRRVAKLLTGRMTDGVDKFWSGYRVPKGAGRPPTRWTDDLIKVARTRWM